MRWPPSPPSDRTWGSLLVELVIIVVGVLIAFGLNSWWDGRTTALRERAYLRALASDVDQNVSRLEAQIETDRRVLESTQGLLERTKAAGPVAQDSARALLANVFLSARFEPVMGTYEALVSSGDLTFIGDDTLRAWLADFAAQVRDDYTTSYTDRLYLDFIHEFADQVPALLREGTGDLDGLLADPRFRGHLHLRSAAERDMLKYYHQLLERGEAIQARLGEVLDERPESGQP